MTNIEEAKKLLKEAAEILDEALSAYERKSWNLTVRRSQEVVELSLKGLIKLIGIEYPKVHDVGAFFVEQTKAKGIDIEPKTLEEIKDISAYLSRERAPAFYFERDYSEEQAKIAKENASKMLDFSTGFFKKVSGS